MSSAGCPARSTTGVASSSFAIDHGSEGETEGEEGGKGGGDDRYLSEVVESLMSGILSLRAIQDGLIAASPVEERFKIVLDLSIGIVVQLESNAKRLKIVCLGLASSPDYGPVTNHLAQPTEEQEEEGVACQVGMVKSMPQAASL